MELLLRFFFSCAQYSVAQEAGDLCLWHTNAQLVCHCYVRFFNGRDATPGIRFSKKRRLCVQELRGLFNRSFRYPSMCWSSFLLEINFVAKKELSHKVSLRSGRTNKKVIRLIEEPRNFDSFSETGETNRLVWFEPANSSPGIL